MHGPRPPWRRSLRLAALFLALSGPGPAVAAADEPVEPLGYAVQVGPLLNLYGCNAGSCHGKAGGQHGFALSLFGAAAAADGAAIRDRVDPSDPAASLLLQKATGQVPHGGGVRIAVDSAEYRALARWIVAQGQVGPPRREPELVGLAVRPARLVVARGRVGRVRVEACLDDGSVCDVTRWSRFEGETRGLVEVGSGGAIRAGMRVGEGTLVARFGASLAVARVVVPSGVVPPTGSLATGSFVDRMIGRKLGELGLMPGSLATDAEFARRSALDIIGRLPDPAAVAAFGSDPDPAKRARWVDSLLARPEYADHFATLWSALLRNRRSLGDLSKPATFGLHAWVREAIAANRPLDRIAGDLIAARGDLASNPAVGWYLNVATTDERAEDAAQVFLGTRIGCARCHHHPTEPWGQADHAAFAAFFARVETRAGADPNSFRVFGRVARAADPAPRALGAAGSPTLGERDDPRAALVAWMVAGDNPFFARAAVNRYWKHFLGRGLVEPVDDLRPTNPPTEPDLLDALADDFRAHGHDLKHLVRTIATSDAYARSSAPDPTGFATGVDLARFAPRRLPAEVLLDAIDLVAGTTTRFAAMPVGTRAVQLPDDGFASPFLDAFGRPARRTACECERIAEPDLTQALTLLNSADLEAKLAAPTGRAARYAGADDPRPDATKVDELYRVALARPPSSDEVGRAVAHLAAGRVAGRTAAAFEDLIWALLNTREFLYNH